MSNIIRSSEVFAGETGKTINISALGCTRPDYGWLIMPTADPGGDLGQIKFTRSANTLIVYNSGDAVTPFVALIFTLISAPEIQGGAANALDYGTKNFAGTTGISIDITSLTLTNPFIEIMPYESNEDIGEIWYTLAANAITVYNGGDDRGAFAYVVGKHN
ncbi:MAG: hypothetical protein WC440_02270 [Candidatus Omnitrophota bacterium]|jgi:hypothetical protein